MMKHSKKGTGAVGGIALYLILGTIWFIMSNFVITQNTDITIAMIFYDIVLLPISLLFWVMQNIQLTKK